jgi:hypothetical protein
MIGNPMQPETPRHEPEIIPPGGDERSARAARMRVFIDAQGNRRIYVTPVSPFGFFWLALVVAVVSAGLLLLIFGAFLFLLPVLFIALAGAILAGLLRGYFRSGR